MKTQEELNVESLVVETLLKLNKANMILSDWTQEYGFSNQPDPKKATGCGSSKSGVMDIDAKQSKKWYYDYNRIYTLIDIVYDYVNEGLRLLEKVTYCEKESKSA